MKKKSFIISKNVFLYCSFLAAPLALQFCLLFTILRPFGIRESIRQKVNHGGQIVLWY